MRNVVSVLGGENRYNDAGLQKIDSRAGNSIRKEMGRKREGFLLGKKKAEGGWVI